MFGSGTGFVLSVFDQKMMFENSFEEENMFCPCNFFSLNIKLEFYLSYRTFSSPAITRSTLTITQSSLKITQSTTTITEDHYYACLAGV